MGTRNRTLAIQFYYYKIYSNSERKLQMRVTANSIKLYCTLICNDKIEKYANFI